MIICIDQKAEEPLYLQIRNQVIAAIARGELVPGAALPSVRALASDLGINLHTVNKAYAVLRDEGYVLMRGRSGAYIADPCEDDRADRARMELAKMEDGLFELALAHRARGGSWGEFLECAQRQAARAYGAGAGADAGSACAAAGAVGKGGVGAAVVASAAVGEGASAADKTGSVGVGAVGEGRAANTDAAGAGGGAGYVQAGRPVKRAAAEGGAL